MAGLPQSVGKESVRDSLVSGSIPDSALMLREQFETTRHRTEQLCRGLSHEDMTVSSMVDVSPTKWHLAHTTWFWERFVLMEHLPMYKVYDEMYLYLFNSYYVQAGERHCRAQRGLVTRPGVAEVMRYRRYVDEAMEEVLEKLTPETEALLRLGMAHEEQHQELMLTDIQHVLWMNPAKPAYTTEERYKKEFLYGIALTSSSLSVKGGMHDVGAVTGFAFDNETPRHVVYVPDFWIGTALVTNDEYLNFVEDGGYKTPSLWLANGWALVQQHKWEMPLYWSWDATRTELMEYTLGGNIQLVLDQPVRCVSYYEADAYARWAGCRLPTEAEWEIASHQPQMQGLFMHGWQWTASAYLPYPGFVPQIGALGEYNGKWMDGAYVLRGGSFATPVMHSRRTYRNFWAPDTRWQYTSIRVAK